MKISIASDHRGFKLKAVLTAFLESKGHVVVDFGTHSPDACDYPDYVYPACLAVKNKKVERSIIICYTGIGSCIAANKVKGVRAALAYSQKSATLSRQHNNSNVLVLPSNLLKNDLIKKLILTWLKAEFQGGRHHQRVKKIKKIEEKENAQRPKEN
ncbi:MAG: ribose 5-phosphate isomerase B [Candidatus Omnitrophica bacterium]|nr:ribose 5-phosphate isomerase B [Candidatus Omnitrophota bacterium]